MSNPSITYAQHPDASPEAEVSALASVYRFVIDRAHRNAAGVTSTNSATLRNMEEVSYVDRRPD